MKEFHVALVAGVILLVAYYMIKELQATSVGDRAKHLADEEAIATAAQTLLPLL